MQSANSDEIAAVHCKYGELPKITAVELPFFTQSPSVAFEALGGEETTCKTIANGGKVMHLKYSQLNRLEPMIRGENVSTNGGLLIRLRRRRIVSNTTSMMNSSSDNSSSNTSHTMCTEQSIQYETDVKILGRVDRAYVFNDPADYQVL